MNVWSWRPYLTVPDTALGEDPMLKALPCSQ